MSTHSNYVDTLAQFGVPGVVGLLGLLGSLWISGIRALRRLADERDQVACAVVLGGLPALGVAMWLGDWLIPFVYNQTIAGFDHSVYSWLMLAMLCGLITQVHAQPAQEPAHA
jgi:O-antigen ligase